MKGPNLRPPWALLPLAFAVLAAQAASSDAPQRCSEIGDDLARLGCYDAIFRKPAASAASTAAPAAAAASAATSVAASPETDFGLTEAAKRARDPQQEILESITGTVTAVGRRPAGELIVTLENGQVWTQVTVDQRARVAAGDMVTIRKAALGSHLLETQGRYATRVRRVK